MSTLRIRQMQTSPNGQMTCGKSGVQCGQWSKRSVTYGSVAMTLADNHIDLWRTTMKLYAPLLLAMLAVPAYSQTESTTGGSTDGSTEAEDTLTLRTGTAFYSDDTYTTMRSAEEMQANWATMSPEDQAAIRTRCEAVIATATEMEPSKGTDAVEGSDTGAATGDDSGSTTAEDMGFMGDDAQLRPLCDAIAAY